MPALDSPLPEFPPYKDDCFIEAVLTPDGVFRVRRSVLVESYINHPRVESFIREHGLVLAGEPYEEEDEGFLFFAAEVLTYRFPVLAA